MSQLEDPPAALEAARARRRELLRAMNEVEAAIAAPAVGRERTWRAAVTHRVVALREAFDEHVAVTENAGGLFDLILSRAPRFVHRIEELRSDHDTIRISMAEVLEHLMRPAEAAPGIDKTREVLLALIVQIARHRQLGADLIWEAYWVDIGGEAGGPAG